MVPHSYVAEYLMKNDLPIQKIRELTNNKLNRKQTRLPFSFSRQPHMNTCSVSCC